MRRVCRYTHGCIEMNVLYIINVYTWRLLILQIAIISHVHKWFYGHNNIKEEQTNELTTRAHMYTSYSKLVIVVCVSVALLSFDPFRRDDESRLSRGPCGGARTRSVHWVRGPFGGLEIHWKNECVQKRCRSPLIQREWEFRPHALLFVSTGLAERAGPPTKTAKPPQTPRKLF